jgi:NADPH oxidase
MILHGSFCFIKSDPLPLIDRCRGGPHFWMWVLPCWLIYIAEKMFRQIRSSWDTSIIRILQHPSMVLEVTFDKPSFRYKSGQYLLLCCPKIRFMIID